MSFTKAIDLPVPDSGCGDVSVGYGELAVRVEFEYRLDGRDLIGLLIFQHVVAFRFRDEMHSAGFAAGSYDCVLATEQSEWLRELAKIEPSGVSDVAGSKHFAVLLSSTGYLELVAREASLGEPREGFLESR